jgi:hypothetical protein
MAAISVAHRPEMSSGADRVIRMGQTLTMPLASRRN